MSNLIIEKEKRDNILFIRFSGEIGLSEEYKFRQEVTEFLKENPNKLIIDLRDITLLSSYGIAGLVNLWKKQKENNRSICILCPPNHVYDSLTIAGTDKIIPIYNEEEKAVNYLKSL